MQNKLKTGIEALDEILGGGIPDGHTVLLAGSCGTGKTILSQQFIFEGARNNNEIGIYLSLSEPREKIIKNLESFTFFDNKLIDEEKVKIVDISTDARLKGVGVQNQHEMMNLFREVVQDSGAHRVVVDSITSVGGNIGEPTKVRDFIYELGFELNYMGCTTILISEVPPQQFVYSVYGVEEFISDGVILLTEFERKGELIRALQVIKMRGVKHSRNKYVLKILEDGINLVPLFKAGIE